jgi:hypothetical protein
MESILPWLGPLSPRFWLDAAPLDGGYSSIGRRLAKPARYETTQPHSARHGATAGSFVHWSFGTGRDAAENSLGVWSGGPFNLDPVKLTRRDVP